MATNGVLVGTASIEQVAERLHMSRTNAYRRCKNGLWPFGDDGPLQLVDVEYGGKRVYAKDLDTLATALEAGASNGHGTI